MQRTAISIWYTFPVEMCVYMYLSVHKSNYLTRFITWMFRLLSDIHIGLYSVLMCFLMAV